MNLSIQGFRKISLLITFSARVLLLLPFMAVDGTLFSREVSQFERVIFIIQKDMPKEEYKVVRDVHGTYKRGNETEVSYSSIIKYIVTKTGKELNIENESVDINLHFLDEDIQFVNGFNSIKSTYDYLNSCNLVSERTRETKITDIFEYYIADSIHTYFAILVDEIDIDYHIGSMKSTLFKTKHNHISGILYFAKFIFPADSNSFWEERLSLLMKSFNLVEYAIPVDKYNSINLKNTKWEAYALPKSDTTENQTHPFDEFIENTLIIENATILSKKNEKHLYKNVLAIDGKKIGIFTIFPPLLDSKNDYFKIAYAPIDTTNFGEHYINISFSFLKNTNGNQKLRKYVSISDSLDPDDNIEKSEIDTLVTNLEDTFTLNLNEQKVFAIPLEFKVRNISFDITLRILQIREDKKTVLAENSFALVYYESISFWKDLLSMVKELLKMILIALVGIFISPYAKKQWRKREARKKLIKKISDLSS